MTAVAALLLAACGSSDPSPRAASAGSFPVYDWEPSGEIPPGPGAAGACRKVLVVGDSLAVETAPFLQRRYDRSGYCAEVVNEAVSGSAPASYHPDGKWTDEFRMQLAEHRPDLVVSFFNGNGGAALQPANYDATTALIAIAAEHGVPMYWVLPPQSAYLCDWDEPDNRDGYLAYRRWVTSNVPGQAATVNGNVLTPNAGPSSGREGYNDTLRIGDEEEVVRDFDCVHLTDPGAAVVAHEIVFSTHGEWAVPGDHARARLHAPCKRCAGRIG